MTEKPDRPKMGRPSKLTEELLRSIVALIEEGDAPEVAAGVNGINRVTYFRWREAGRTAEPGTLLHTFATEVARACDVAESNMRRKVMGGDGIGEGFGQAKATLEILSRRFPKRWAQRVKQEIDDSNRLVLDVVQRVCREQDCPEVFVRVCEELSRLDSEGEAAGDPDGATAAVH